MPGRVGGGAFSFAGRKRPPPAVACPRIRRIGRSETVLLFLVSSYLMICWMFWYSIDTSLPEHTVRASRQGLPERIASMKRIFLQNADEIDPLPQGNNLLYVGKFGLGHRLSKLVSAYHLACQDDLCSFLEEFHVDWGTCGNTTATGTSDPDMQEDVFSYLFGSNRLRISCEPSIDKIHQKRNPSKTLIVRNDVQGYYAGQSYKNARIPLSRTAMESPHHVWNRKMDFDRAFFAQLLKGFRQRHGEALENFQRQHQWDQHYVVGLHLRAGNGEKDHFVQADRGVTNWTDWCHTVATTLRCAFEGVSLPVLVFLSTDTKDLIPVVQAALSDVRVVLFPQARLPPKEGVTYQKWTEGEQCYDGWKSAMTDMALLASSDMLVAASRSTFTQILPLSQVMGTSDNRRPSGKYKFCEVGDNGKAMTCFPDRKSWFLRQEGEKTWRSPTKEEDGRCNAIVPSPMKRSEPNHDNDRIVHKVMVHLPDVEDDPLKSDALAFLAADSTESRFYYGPAFSRKYRGGANKAFAREWTWIDDTAP